VTSMIYAAFASALEGPNGRVVQIVHPRVTFLAANNDGRAALLAHLTLRPDQVVQDGKGFTVKTQRNGTERFVRISSADPGLSLMFLKLVEFVLERTAQAQHVDDEANLLVQAVDEFRRFTQRKPGRLSEDAIRGLVAELQLLLELQAGDGGRTWGVFHAWGGPFGAAHDFEFLKGKAIEVKSAHHPPSEVRISSPAQTTPSSDGLDLLVLPLERVSPALDPDIRFVDLVRDVGALAAARGDDVVEVWDSALNALGLDLNDDYYAQWCFARGEWLRFAVTDGFPGISADDIPTGVVKVTYSLRLDALSEFALSYSDLEVIL